MCRLMPGWTKAKVIDRIKKYNNGTPAATDAGQCVYLAKDGNRCFIGAFIPEGHPALFRREGVQFLLVRYPELRHFMPFSLDQELVTFQNVHDYLNKLDSKGSTYEALERFLADVIESEFGKECI